MAKSNFIECVSLFIILVAIFFLGIVQARAQSCQLPIPIEKSEYSVLQDIDYSTEIKKSPHNLDIYQRKANTPRPLVIYVHGGGWQKGDKGGFEKRAIQFMSLGYSVVSMNYPLTSWNGEFPRSQNTENPIGVAIKALRCGLRFLNKNSARYNFDPERVVIIGSSAGGNLGGMLAYAPQEQKGGLDYKNCEHNDVEPLDAKAFVGNSGVYDLTHPITIERGGASNYIGQDDPELKMRKARYGSPIYRVDSSDPETILIHAEGDRTVTVAQAEVMSEKLERKGVSYQTFIIPNNDHVLDWFSEDPLYMPHSCAIKRLLLRIKR